MDREFAKCGFTDDILVIPDEVELDLLHQFTLHLCPYINGTLEAENRDSPSFKENLSNATLATSKIVPSDPIQYLILCPTPPIFPPSSVVNETLTVSMSDQIDEADALMILQTTAATSQVDPSAPSSPKGEALTNRSEEICDDYKFL